MAGDKLSDDAENRKSKTQNRNWLWFFAALVLLGAAAVSINWAYNARRQLTMEQLRKNEDLWDKAGPANYDLTVHKIYRSANEDKEHREQIDVKVVKGKVVAASLDNRPMPERLWDKYDMTAWFDYLEDYLKQGAATGAPRTYLSADFDPKTGALLHFTRSVFSTRERQEVTFQLTSTPK